MPAPSDPGRPLAAITNALVGPDGRLVDIALRDGVITAIRDAGGEAPEDGQLDAGGLVVLPGLVDAHVHLDKAHILDRLPGDIDGLPAAIQATSAIKDTFTADDVTARSERVLGALVRRGVTTVRAHAEVEPGAGLVSVETHLALRERWADVVDLEIVAFAQEGILRDRRTGELMDEAMRLGCDVVGICPYADVDGHAAIEDGFARAARWSVPLDVHLDFSDDPRVHLTDDVAHLTAALGFQGRVALGHMTSLGAMAPADAQRRIEALAAAEVGVLALPATDLYLSGRGVDRAWPRGLTRVLELIDAGVPVALATNNHGNGFTPTTTPDPLRMAWLTMLMTHAPAGRWPDLADAVTGMARRALGRPPGGIAPGKTADLVVLDTQIPSDAVLAAPATIGVVRRGRWTAYSTGTA
ncbi:amidohydrolase family protein [Svornostia abyssi]|uniref:Amidohydrolase family protein n=1 Tax=Svornostia abyssi TaxID=2898438 RepID=A0ABY5PDY7_9ACTN|nr:amidohydrolase family protein [Parviterribacteraceae bacterium J379]